MKKWKRFLPLLLLALLVACGEADVAMLNDPVGNSATQQSMACESPVYGFESTERTEHYVREDTGEVAASYHYRLPMMYLVNEDRVSAIDRETAQRNLDAFNAWMNERMEEFVTVGGELLAEQQFLIETGENVPFVAEDEVVAAATQTGEIVSVTAQCYQYGGGAHPNAYTVSYTFDLSVGQFIDPTQVADDPENFRICAAELLIQHADALDEEYTSGFWADYRDSIARWNESAVIFSQSGMTVTFSVYTLGPYALGPVELTLSYRELAEALGVGGLAHLGVAERSNT